MDIDQARTFLAIAASGSFIEAGRRMHVTQSTVSARIQRLEEELGTRLFVRNRSGATLTVAGRRFGEYAKRLVETAEQARHHVGLPSGYRATLRVGARIALWDTLLPAWIGWLREREPEVAVRAGIGFEEDLIRDLIEGALDIGLMYTPRLSPGLVVEPLFEESLMLVSSRPDDAPPGHDYIQVEWGQAFDIQHARHHPDCPPPARVVNIGWLALQLILSHGGSCYLPERMAAPLIASGRLHAVAGAARHGLQAYAVYQKAAEHPVLTEALAGLRALCGTVPPVQLSR